VFEQIKKIIDHDLKTPMIEISDPTFPIKRKKKKINIQNLMERNSESKMEKKYEEFILKMRKELEKKIHGLKEKIHALEETLQNKEENIHALEEKVFSLELKLLKNEIHL
jgi:SMC interacting uncharacterized protein involved in chromosome segregation